MGTATRLDALCHYLIVFIVSRRQYFVFPNHIPSPLLTTSLIPLITFGPVTIPHLNFFSLFIVPRILLPLHLFHYFSSLVGSLPLPL
jgi:hypothetical protein